MWMYTGGGIKTAANPKPEMIRTLEAIGNYIVTEATESEMFTFRVVREIFANAHRADIEKAIKKLTEPPSREVT